MAETERRSFFRVNSELALSYQLTDAYSVENEKPEDQFSADAAALSVFSELQRLNHEASTLLSGIGEKSRQLADYLAIQNKKIDVLAHSLLSSDYMAKEVKPTHVNLSEGGLAFISSKALYKGSYLALRMVFVETYTVVVCFARVIRCEEKEPDSYQVALKFIGLHEVQQQTLSKNIFQAQLRSKKRKEQQQKTDKKVEQK